MCAAFVWGDNSAGCVGVGPSKPSKHNVKPQLLAALAEHRSIDVSCGSTHTLLLTDSGKVFVWGSNRGGQVWYRMHNMFLLKEWALATHFLCDAESLQLGTGDTRDCTVPTELTTAVNFRIIPPSFMTPEEIRYEPTAIPGIVAVAAGMNHSMCLSDEGKVYCFGWNEHGRCGLPTTNDDDPVLQPVSACVQCTRCHWRTPLMDETALCESCVFADCLQHHEYSCQHRCGRLPQFSAD